MRGPERWFELVFAEAAGALLSPIEEIRDAEDVNLFDLGFNSLLLVRMQMRLRENGATGLSLSEMMERPTLTSLAAYLGERYG